MTEQLFSLQCPACGAGLQTSGEQTRCRCKHCGNSYLLERKPAEMTAADRQTLQPAITYTQKTGQWLGVGPYEICLHQFSVQNVKQGRLVSIEVECRNPGEAQLTCRHDQWVIFDQLGYTYEALRDFDQPELYAGKPYLGLTRLLHPAMHLRGWLVFLLPTPAAVAYLQFACSSPPKSVEYRCR